MIEIGSINLEGRVVRFSTSDGVYSLDVLDTAGNPISDQSKRLNREDITNSLTHIPEQQISGLRRYGAAGIAALVLLFGAVVGAYSIKKTGHGHGAIGSLSIAALAALGILHNYTPAFNSKEVEFNRVLSQYGLPTLGHSK